MIELSLYDIQRIELGLLQQFDEICRNNHLRYSLGGGTLLGAIRHHGFIPWDDDVDVMMPRPDYDTFIAYCRTHETPFDVIDYESTPGYYGLFAKISARDTIIKDSVIDLDCQMGVSIDVFPLDGLGNTYNSAVKNYRKTEWNRELLNAAAWKKYTRSKTHGLVYEPIRFCLFLLSRFAKPKKIIEKIDRINRSISFDQSSFAGCVCGSYRLREVMEQKAFAEYITIEFENCQFQAIKAYDAYLTKHYNNYMELPPEEKRQTHHTYKAYRIDSKKNAEEIIQ